MEEMKDEEENETCSEHGAGSRNDRFHGSRSIR